MHRWKLLSKHSKILIGLALTLVLCIVCLDILSRVCTVQERGELSCRELITQYVPEAVQQIYGQGGTAISPGAPKASVQDTLTDRVFEVEAGDIDGLSGMACDPYVFIVRGLLREAAKYISLHEAYHVSGISSEAVVNYKAGLKYPWGMAETVERTIGNKIIHTSFREYPCLGGSTWRLFKIYFLGDTCPVR